MKRVPQLLSLRCLQGQGWGFLTFNLPVSVYLDDAT